MEFQQNDLFNYNFLLFIFGGNSKTLLVCEVLAKGKVCTVENISNKGFSQDAVHTGITLSQELTLQLISKQANPH